MCWTGISAEAVRDGGHDGCGAEAGDWVVSMAFVRDSRSTSPRSGRISPSLHQLVHGQPLVYLDNAATSQKPSVGARRDSSLLRARQRQRPSGRPCVERTRDRRLRGGARTRARVHERRVGPRDRLHAKRDRSASTSWRGPGATRTSVPATKCSSRRWSTTPTSCRGSRCARRTGAVLRVVPMDDRGELVMEEFERLLTPTNEDGGGRPRVERARHRESGRSRSCAWRTTSAPRCSSTVRRRSHHLPTDVQALGADFYVFTGPQDLRADRHRRALREGSPPRRDAAVSRRRRHDSHGDVRGEHLERPAVQVRGGYAEHRRRDRPWARHRVPAGRGLRGRPGPRGGAARQGHRRAQRIDGVRLIGTARHKVAVVSFIIDGVHPHDIGTIVDREGVAIRTGHHCAQPVMDRLGIPATARASFAIYNTLEEIDVLAAAVTRARTLLG